MNSCLTIRRIALLIVLLVAVVLNSGCSREQLKRGTYGAIHERERQKCLQQGQRDCPGYPGYDTYRREVEQARDNESSLR